MDELYGVQLIFGALPISYQFGREGDGSSENIILFSPEQFHEIPKGLSKTQVFHIDRLSRD